MLSKLSQGVIAGAFMVTLSLMGGGFVLLTNIENDLRYHEFKQDAIKDIMLYKETLDMVEQSSEYLKSLYHASDSVSWAKFSMLANSIIERHPSINNLQWVPAIERNKLFSFKQVAQKDFPGFELLDLSKNSPDSIKKNWYYPIYYLYPQDDSKLGVDLGSQVDTLKSLELARDLGTKVIKNIASSQTVENNHHVKSLMFVQPVFKGPSHTLHERRQNITGFIISVVDLTQLFLEAKIEGQINPILLFESHEKGQSVTNLYLYNEDIKLGEQDWVVQVQSAKANYHSYNWFTKMGMAIMVLLVIMLWGIIFWYRLSHQRAAGLIAQKTQQLSFVNNMLTSNHMIQQMFINDDNPSIYFNKMLSDLIQFTQSAFGFIGQVLEKEGKSYIKTVAISNMAWDYNSRKYYSEHQHHGVIFDDPDTLFGEVLKTKALVIANALSDTSIEGLLPGHPALTSFVGIPFHVNQKFVGVACLANRPQGYHEKLIQSLSPVIANCGFILNEYKIKLEKQSQEKQNFTRARMDPLTQLPNRFLFQEESEKFLDLAIRKRHQFALLYLDLDNFKPVNDQFGHETGDQLLVKVAQILQEQTRASDFIARIGGDEFAILLNVISSSEEPLDLANKLLAVFAHPIMVDGMALEIGLSIGYAIFPEHGNSIEMLLNYADQAMYDAKRLGKNQVHRSKLNWVAALHKPQLEQEVKKKQENS